MVEELAQKKLDAFFDPTVLLSVTSLSPKATYIQKEMIRVGPERACTEKFIGEFEHMKVEAEAVTGEVWNEFGVNTRDLEMTDGRKRRVYGEHLTSVEVFKKYIFPTIADRLYDFVWVDLFAGEGNLILPILGQIPKNERTEFFKKHVFLFEIQNKLVEECIKRATSYGIPREIAEKNIIQRDTIENYPDFITKLEFPVFHITNPPYLYRGYIPKQEETQKYLRYFKGKNEGYQDLYQLALMNDLRHELKHLIYVIPANFLFGFSVSNKIRDDFLSYYLIKKALIFEKRIFEYTGTNVVICFFERKPTPSSRKIFFKGVKINEGEIGRKYVLDPKNHFRAGDEFKEFVEQFKSPKPLQVNYYLLLKEVETNVGNHKMAVIDASSFTRRGYKKTSIFVNDELFRKIKSNILFVKTLDTGGSDGRAGLYLIREKFGVDGILVSKYTYRTYPIQIFLDPTLTEKDQIALKNYFNFVLEYFRKKTDSEFLTTYKYSSAKYTRKYMGLSQARKLIQTFPILRLKEEKNEFLKLIESKDASKIFLFMEKKIGHGKLTSYF